MAIACRSSAQKGTDPNENTNNEPYPDRILLKSLPDGLSNDFGLKALVAIKDLSGSLSWVGDVVTKADKDSKYITPILQRLDIDPQEKRMIRNWELPQYDPQRVKLLGLPVFNGGRNECYVRAWIPEPEYSYYSVYRLNFASRQGEILRDSGSPNTSFLPSPDGTKLAYDSQDVYSGANYEVIVTSGSKSATVSNQKASNGFSWTENNELVYSAFPKTSKTIDNFGYPNIYQNNLRGSIRLLKEGGYRPVLSRSQAFIAYFGPDSSVGADARSREHQFLGSIIGRVAIHVYDRQRGREHYIKRVYENYPDLIWVGDSLLIIENTYRYKDKIAQCRISEYTVSNRKLKNVCVLEQKGLSSRWEDNDFRPHFTTIGVANGSCILLQVPVREGGANNFRVVAVSRGDGLRKDIFSFSGKTSAYAPHVAWVDENETVRR